MYNLSILIPSSRPEKLEELIVGLRNKAAAWHMTQLVILVDDEKEYVEIQDNIFTIHHVPEKPVSIVKLFKKCYEIAQADWIMLGNDDLWCKTEYWDDKIFDAIDLFDDQLGLIWVNDELFQDQLSCFPVISKKLINLVDLFSLPYQRYRFDDAIFEIVPQSRKRYLKDVVFCHLNTNYKIAPGETRATPYPEAIENDVKVHDDTTMKRIMMKIKLLDELIPKNTKILIGVSTQEMARQAIFYDYFNLLSKPDGTTLSLVHGQSPARARNIIIQQAIDNNCTHVMLIDDDMAIRPHILKQLLSHDKDVVSALYVARAYPHYPMMFDWFDEKMHARFRYLKPNDYGLIPIVCAGFGAVLFKTDVFKCLNKPYVRLGELNSEEWCDDIGFFGRLHATNVEMFCDLDAPVGHMGSYTVWPQKMNGEWYSSYDTGHPTKVSIPVVKEPMKNGNS